MGLEECADVRLEILFGKSANRNSDALEADGEHKVVSVYRPSGSRVWSGLLVEI